MSAYCAIIWDSFREALASRVLWILVALITLVLVALIPLGWKFQLTSRIRPEDIRNVAELASELAAGRHPTAPGLVRHIWSLLPTKLQTQLIDFQPGDESRPFATISLRRDLANSLDELLDRQDFYDASQWEGVQLNDEAARLAERGPDQLTPEERRRLHRLALEAAIARQLRPSPDKSVLFTYFGWDVGIPLPMNQQQLTEAVEATVSVFMSFFAGVVGVFAAILVTAPIIPNTFSSGSISLLLSKPISRPLLFLTKFVGACSFVLINVTYLIVGLCLLTGLRFGVWNYRLLWCIPVFLFLFAVYYSVSALAGLVWRSAVMSVVMTILFWLACTVVGTTKGLVDVFVIQPRRVVQLIPAGDALLAVRQTGEVNRWDASQRGWVEVFSSGETRPPFAPPMMTTERLIGPIYDSQHDRLLAVKQQWPQPRLLVGRREDDWLRIDVAQVPRDSRHLLDGKDDVVIVARDGAYRVADELKPAAEGINIFGFKLPLPTPPAVTKITPDVSDVFRESSSAAIDATNNDLLLWKNGTIVRLTRNPSGDYREASSTQFGDPSQDALLAAAGPAIVAARDDGVIEVASGEAFQERRTFQPFGRNQPRQVVASPDGRWLAVLFHNDRLWLYDHVERRALTDRVPSQRDISAVTLLSDNRILLADRVDRVTQYHLPDMPRQNRYAPRPSVLETVYRYLIRPIYIVFPKPGELDQTVSFILTGRETVEIQQPGNPSAPSHIKLNPWSPVWSSMAFTAVMLIVGCVYMQQQEF